MLKPDAQAVISRIEFSLELMRAGGIIEMPVSEALSCCMNEALSLVKSEGISLTEAFENIANRLEQSLCPKAH